jgi:Uma2 family endonuclease
MHTRAEYEQRDDRPIDDHIVRLHEASWEDYRRLLEIRGDHSAPRISYLEGEIEIMSPSQTHEAIKSMIGRLVESYCLERDIPFSAYGSWTLEAADRSRAAEPDECYVFGTAPAERPQLAIEVVWTSGRIDKLDIYRKLGVAEVWFWRRGRIQPYCLRGERYVPAEASEVLPGLDLDLLTGFIDRPTTFEAIRAYRDALRSQG